LTLGSSEAKSRGNRPTFRSDGVFADHNLREENRVLRAVNGSRRLRLTDDQRRRLAVKGQVLVVVTSRPSPAS
jgi:hypothetical protein